MRHTIRFRKCFLWVVLQAVALVGPLALRQAIGANDHSDQTHSPSQCKELTDSTETYYYQCARYLYEADSAYLRGDLELSKKKLGVLTAINENRIGCRADSLMILSSRLKAAIHALQASPQSAVSTLESALVRAEHNTLCKVIDTCVLLCDLGAALTACGKYGDAELRLRNALADAENRYGRVHFVIGDCHLGLGRLLFITGRIRDAASEMQFARSIFQESLPLDRDRLAIATMEFGVVLDSLMTGYAGGDTMRVAMKIAESPDVSAKTRAYVYAIAKQRRVVNLNDDAFYKLSQQITIESMRTAEAMSLAPDGRYSAAANAAAMARRRYANQISGLAGALGIPPKVINTFQE